VRRRRRRRGRRGGGGRTKMKKHLFPLLRSNSV